MHTGTAAARRARRGLLRTLAPAEAAAAAEVAAEAAAAEAPATEVAATVAAPAAEAAEVVAAAARAETVANLVDFVTYVTELKAATTIDVQKLQHVNVRRRRCQKLDSVLSPTRERRRRVMPKWTPPRTRSR